MLRIQIIYFSEKSKPTYIKFNYSAEAYLKFDDFNNLKIEVKVLPSVHTCCPT